MSDSKTKDLPCLAATHGCGSECPCPNSFLATCQRCQFVKSQGEEKAAGDTVMVKTWAVEFDDKTTHVVKADNIYSAMVLGCEASGLEMRNIVCVALSRTT